jgi:cytosine/adenosine deaminase-related metal-dependent hydrolase
MLDLRARRAQTDAPGILDAATAAIRQAQASGTLIVGDVSNTLLTPRLLAAAGMSAHVFHEILGFGGTGADEQVRGARLAMDAACEGEDVRCSLAPHAPYSVSPALFRAIRADLDAHGASISTVHLAESPEEVEFLRTGGGPWRTLLEGLGVWNPSWRPPGTSPAAYLSDLGFLARPVLAVHGVQLDLGDLHRLRESGATLVSCPRSNVYVGVGAPPLELFYDSGVDVAFGTDSLASVADLDMFAELAEARRIAPRVPARALLRSATLVGARALGFADCGSLEPGQRAGLIAVRVPAGVIDVEEYLVSGVAPDRVSWISEASPRA